MTKRASGNNRTLFTIGYQGRQVEDVVSRIKSVGVTVLVDVRYRPQSRKPGFSRARLEDFCASAGIAYVHIRELGTPPDLMRRFGPGGYDAETFAEYRRFLKQQHLALDEAQQLIAKDTCCLLCYESDAATCHRHVVADELGQIAGRSITHL